MLTSINLSLSSLCNGSCIFCPNDKGKHSVQKIMTFETAKQIIDEIAESELIKTVNQILVSENGDPLTNPDMIKILRYIKSKLPNISVSLFSNFQLMTQEIAYPLLNEKLIRSVFVNIDSINEKYYKELKGLNLQIVLKNLKNFITVRNSICSSLSVGVIIIPLQKYIQETINRLQFAPKKLSAENIINYKEIENDGETTKEYIKKDFPLQSNDSITISSVMLWAERESVTSEHKKGKCININRVMKEAFISPDGDWYICCFDSAHNIKFGNVIEKSIMEIENSEKREKIIKLLKEEKFEEIGYPCTTSICCEIS